MSTAEPRSLPSGTLTLMFTDMEGSTELAQAMGAEAFSGLVADHRVLIRAALTTHGGIEIDTAGDGFFAVFTTVRDAVAAAVDAQRSLRQHDWPPGSEARVRIGLHTGEPHRSSAGYSGVAVHRAARICAAGHGGQILLSNTTAGVVEDEMMPGVALLELGEHSLKGLSAPQRLAQLVVDGLEAQFGPLRTTDSGPVAAEAGTFLLTDLAGWRRIVLEFGDKTSASLMTDYQERVGVAVAVHHGTLLQQAGDEAIAVFIKASDAIAAVDSLRASLERIPLPPRIEVSLSGVIHSGHWSGTTQAPEAGTALYRLRRLAQVMQPGQVLVSPSTAALLDGNPLHHRLHDLGEVPVQDDGETIAIHELTEPA